MSLYSVVQDMSSGETIEISDYVYSDVFISKDPYEWFKNSLLVFAGHRPNLTTKEKEELFCRQTNCIIKHDIVTMKIFITKK
ncbi:MAG TPA: hypothetical protein VL443_24245 [Cyclobacteriaceae bacterium]|jgi:hypothetical protein|nr:hypothetical protein [Cyclobacteriaceae bacterium]